MIETGVTQSRESTGQMEPIVGFLVMSVERLGEDGRVEAGGEGDE